MKKTNKYQEALNNLKQAVLNCGSCEGDYDASICSTKCSKNKDILILQELVDKETVKRTTIKMNEPNGTDKYCPICNSFVYSFDKYCSKCGQRINWEEELY